MRVVTEGAIYDLDRVAMTAQRMRREGIEVRLDGEAMSLASWPAVRPGYPMELLIDDRVAVTTAPVISAPNLTDLTDNVLAASKTFRITAWKKVAGRRKAFVKDRVPAKLHESHVVGSLNPITSKHRVMLDIDHHAYLIPSSRPGHSHLYIDHEMTWRKYKKTLRALYKAGVIERSFYEASCGARMTMLRLPWIKKEHT